MGGNGGAYLYKWIGYNSDEVKLGKTRSLVPDMDTLMRGYIVPHKRLECIRVFLIYVASTYKWMMPYLKGIYLNIDGCRERRDKYSYKTKSQPRVRLKIWEWEHDNWLEEK